MQATQKHYHGWILRIEGPNVSLEPMTGEYTNDMKCRRHATKEAGGDASKIVVLVCRSEDNCPSRIREAALAT